VTHQLRVLGHDVLTTLEAGNANQRIPDDELLAYAAQLNKTVLTLNRRDFIRLHLNNNHHAGIIVCTLDADSEGQAQRIHEAIQQEPTLFGKLLRVNRPG